MLLKVLHLFKLQSKTFCNDFHRHTVSLKREKTFVKPLSLKQ